MTFVKTAEPITAPARLRARNLGVGYGERLVLDGLDVDLPAGELTVIVGPNGCGKSTLLRALARVVPARAGSVELDGKPIGDYPTRQVARRLGLLPQSPVAPDGITVTDLVARGRYPHQGIFRQWSDTDADAVDDAMRRAGVTDLAGRQVSQLSGGQRQRVWIAMALAQQTPILLLDEPTTYLDVAHQVEVAAAHPQPATRRLHGGGRAARPAPGVPLRHPAAGDEGRPDRRPGGSGRDRHHGTDRGRLRAALPGAGRPRN
nr:ABC transporter ATP-binding protein [Micropruina sp.]